MTTREYILRDARRFYERLDALDERMHFVLALEDYTRRDRAKILYNHLWHSASSQAGLSEIARGGYKRIVDHPNFSPRLIEYCTSQAFDTRSPGYVARFVRALDHPERVWRHAFEHQLNLEQRLLAVTMVTLPSEVAHEDLRKAQEALCDRHSVRYSTWAFRAALDVMEGSFLSLDNFDGTIFVGFHNPSIREFVLDWLVGDGHLLSDVLESALFIDQIYLLHAYATVRAGDDGPNEALRAALDERSHLVARALERLIMSPALGMHRFLIYGVDEGWLESRLCEALRLPDHYLPPGDWFQDQVCIVAARWQKGVGGRSDAVSLMKALRRRGVGRRAPAMRDDLVESASVALDEWLEADLPLDVVWFDAVWLPYLDNLWDQYGLAMRDNQGLRQRFEACIRDGIDGNDDFHPDTMLEIVEYTERLGLTDLREDLRQIQQNTWGLVEEPRRRSAKRSAGRDDDLEMEDAELDGLFWRLRAEPRTRQYLPEP